MRLVSWVVLERHVFTFNSLYIVLERTDGSSVAAEVFLLSSLISP